MRRVIYGAACSLDGFIAGPNGEIDWLHMGKDVQAYMSSFWKSIDTILLGRKTYDIANAMGGAPPMPGIVATYVFSRTLTEVKGKNTHLVREDAGAFVNQLRTQPGKNICMMGGGELAQSLLRAGAIDEIGISIQPILLGAGIPFLRDAGRIPLELIENRLLDGKFVLATYQVKR